MEIGSSFSSGVQGFQQASGQITEETININRQAAQQRENLASEQDAQQVQAPVETPVAQQAAQNPSLESSVVNLVSEQHNAQANVRSIETADEVLGSIIDLRV